MENKLRNSFALFEQLPNEVLIDIFSYLNGVDTVFAFLNLNKRFQSLIFEYCQLFNFKSTNKNIFDIVLQYHNTNQWKSLQLFDNDETPGQINYFFENYSFENHFHQLQSLSILGLKSFHKYRLLSQLPFLSNLISLQIESICGRNISQFDLPKLKKLVITSCRHTNWIKNFSQIETIEYTIMNCCLDERILEWPSTIKHLKVVFSYDGDYLLLQHSLTHLSQLITLEIYQLKGERILPDGQIWEQIIRSSLPLLKNFKFYFQFFLYSTHELEQAITSFTTPFYILKNNWFSRGEIYAHTSRGCVLRKFAVLYSIPFPLEKFTIYSNRWNKDISIPSNNIPCYNIFINIKTLIIETDRKPDHNFNETEVINLIINTFFYPLNWLDILTKLRHLDIINCKLFSMENFRILLDNTPYLSSLTVKYSLLKILTDNWSNASVCNYLSQKIHSLKLHANKCLPEYLSRNDLEQIVSFFASKCEHLSLCVQSKLNTVDFILRTMSQLSSLYMHIEGRDPSPITIEWLEQQQTRYNHSNCIIVNNEDDYYFWLG